MIRSSVSSVDHRVSFSLARKKTTVAALLGIGGEKRIDILQLRLGVWRATAGEGEQPPWLYW